MAKYVCPVCGYVHEGDAPPEKCPQCNVPGSKFIKKGGGQQDWMHSSTTKKGKVGGRAGGRGEGKIITQETGWMNGWSW